MKKTTGRGQQHREVVSLPGKKAGEMRAVWQTLKQSDEPQAVKGAKLDGIVKGIQNR